MALDILYILSDSGIKFRPHLNLENADVSYICIHNQARNFTVTIPVYYATHCSVHYSPQDSYDGCVEIQARALWFRKTERY